MFIHTGVVHLVVSYVAQLRLGVCLEQDYGRLKIAFMYILCSVFGSVVSAIFQPKVLQLGSNGALCGYLALKFKTNI